MIVFVNPNAGGGTALARWREVEPEMTRRIPRGAVHILRASADIRRMLPTMVEQGDTHFVAAGGDGTVNNLINAVMTLPPEQRSSIVIGAIGLGSSNDFHKPIMHDRLISGIPYLLSAASARHRDVGVLTYHVNGATLQRHFLVNASIGLTAEANHFFNNPDWLLARLKRRSGRLAIVYATARTLLTYVDTSMLLWLTGGGTIRLHLTNLAIMKSPHLSGRIVFPIPMQTDTGVFGICLAHSLQLGARLRLLASLIRGSLPESGNIRTWRSSFLSIRSDRPFAVECDGEIIHTTAATFSILPKHIQICTC